MRPRTILLLSVIALYLLCLSAWFASRNLMLLDEFFAWNLLSDHSFRHAIGSWNQGADSGGILYYLLLWPIVRLTHASVLVARLFSAVCYVLAGAVWWRCLSRFLDAQSAALGVLLVWCSTGLLLLYTAQIRFYAPFLLFAALAVWATLRASTQDVPPGQAAAMVFAAHACLVLIHMLGIVYSALIIGASLLCLTPRKRSLVIALSAIASWLTLAPCRAAIRNGSANATSQGVPVFGDVLRFHYRATGSIPVLLITLVGLLFLVRSLAPHARLRPAHKRSALFGPMLCVAFLAAPFALYVISHLGRPLGQARYLLPYYLSLCTLSAYALAPLSLPGRPKLGNFALIAFLLLLISLHILAVRTLPTPPSLNIGQLAQLAAGKPVVVADEQSFFELQYYRSTPDLQFHFLLPPGQVRPVGMMATVAARGYFPNSFQPIDRFVHSYPAFFYIASSVPGRAPWVLHDPACHAQQVSTVTISGFQDAVYDVTGCGTAE